MSKQRREVQGVTTTGQYLTVHFTEGDGSVKRLREVKVPWDMLLDSDTYLHMNRAETARLKRHWEGEDLTLPPW